MGAHELVEAGRQHVATGRIREAMACFKRAADDPERGAEALSLLAAAYLLPGWLAPELALAHAHRADHQAGRPDAGSELEGGQRDHGGDGALTDAEEQ